MYFENDFLSKTKQFKGPIFWIQRDYLKTDLYLGPRPGWSLFFLQEPLFFCIGDLNSRVQNTTEYVSNFYFKHSVYGPISFLDW